MRRREFLLIVSGAVWPFETGAQPAGKGTRRIAIVSVQLAFLGIESPPAFVRAPERNGCAERFIRTLKENLLWVRTFDTVEELRRGAARLSGDLQHDLAHRTAWVPDTRAAAAKPAFTCGHGRVGINSGVYKTGGATPGRNPRSTGVCRSHAKHLTLARISLRRCPRSTPLHSTETPAISRPKTSIWPA